jgi:hypothetical protein
VNYRCIGVAPTCSYKTTHCTCLARMANEHLLKRRSLVTSSCNPSAISHGINPRRALCSPNVAQLNAQGPKVPKTVTGGPGPPCVGDGSILVRYHIREDPQTPSYTCADLTRASFSPPICCRPPMTRGYCISAHRCMWRLYMAPGL